MERSGSTTRATIVVEKSRVAGEVEGLNILLL